MKKMVAGLLIAGMLMALPTGCAKKTTSTTAGGVTVIELPETKIETAKRENGNQAVFELANKQSGKIAMSDEELKKAYSEFVLGVMKRCVEMSNGTNVMISADSILLALEMTAAGANGNTLDQMTQTMLPGADNVTALEFASKRMKSLQNDSLAIANSIWMNSGKTNRVYADYLDFVKQTFDAEVSAVAFDPAGAATINKWVEAKTKGRIKELIKELSPEGLMVLVNAITFDGKWKTEYTENDVATKSFTNGKGDTKEVTFLNSTESVFLNNEKATGFLKDYDDGKYAFMTILPNDKAMDINEFIANMTTEEYWAFWESQSTEWDVTTSMPEFKSEYMVELQTVLKDMGMTDAFTPGVADFSNMATSDPTVSQVVHKTYIDVNREGTAAAAATAVIMYDEAVMISKETRSVICNRPYAYAVVEKDTGLPVFFGTVENV
ncbi:MAG: serpin family protein [Clostridiales bacterium]|nr:serpin family protein [Clostridiales bacterium]